MKRFFVFLISFSALAVGGAYFAAETWILPKQEEVWRTLLADLPEGYTADFDEMDFNYVGLRVTVSDVTMTYIDGSSLKVDEVIAENSPRTALKNLLWFVLKQEEENYDLVRFVGITPNDASLGSQVSLDEVRFHNVKIGIVNKLPTTMRSLTGAIGLEEAFQNSKADGIEILGLTVEAQGVKGELASFKLLDVTDTNVGLFEITGFGVSQQGQELATLDLMRMSNVNIAAAMEPEKLIERDAAGKMTNLADFNVFHMADEMILHGLKGGMPGLLAIGIGKAEYHEEVVEILDSVGIVPTKTSGLIEDYFVDFGGMAALSPELGTFIQATEISSVTLDSRSTVDWDLATSEYEAASWLALENLIKLTVGVELANLSAEEAAGIYALALDIQGGENMPSAGNTGEMIAAAMGAYGAIELKGLDILIENQSLVERLIKYGAVMTGSSEADLKAMIDQQLQVMEVDPSMPASMAAHLQALRTFMADPGSLQITVSPESPVSFADMAATQDPNLLIESLGLEVTANRSN